MKKTFLIFALILFASCGSNAVENGLPQINETVATPAPQVEELLAAPELRPDFQDEAEAQSAAEENPSASELADPETLSSMKMEDTGTLRLTCLYHEPDASSYNLVNEAVRLFNEKYPLWNVIVEPYGEFDIQIIDGERIVYYGGEDSYNYNLALAPMLKEENPEGFDLVLISDAMDWGKLIMEGALEDLTPFLMRPHEEIDINSFLPGVIIALQNEHKDYTVYTLPVCFTIWHLNIYDPDVVFNHDKGLPYPWGWDEAVSFFTPVAEQNGLETMFQIEPMYMTATVYRQILPKIYDYANDEYIFENIYFRELAQIIKMMYVEELLLDEEFWYVHRGMWPDGLLQVPYRFLNNAAADFERLVTHGINGYFPMPSVLDYEGLNIMPMDEFAISANAPNKNAAWEFMKILFSDEIQNGPEMFYQPVVADLTAEGVNRALGNAPDFEIPDEDVRAFNRGRFEYFSRITHVDRSDYPPSMLGKVMREVNYFCANEKTLDEIINTLQIEADFVVQTAKTGG